MPEISRFFGIVIKMFFDDHNLVSYKITSRCNKSGNQITGVEFYTVEPIFRHGVPRGQNKLLYVLCVLCG